MNREEAEKIALEILTEATNTKQAWNDYCDTKMLVVPMDVLQALTIPDKNIKVIEGELSRLSGLQDALDGKSDFISDLIGLCSGSVKVRITVENLEVGK